MKLLWNSRTLKVLILVNIWVKKIQHREELKSLISHQIKRTQSNKEMEIKLSNGAIQNLTKQACSKFKVSQTQIY